MFFAEAENKKLRHVALAIGDGVAVSVYAEILQIAMHSLKGDLAFPKRFTTILPNLSAYEFMQKLVFDQIPEGPTCTKN